MYISKALQNIRQRPNGRYPNLASDALWSPQLGALDGNYPMQGPASFDRAGGVVFSSGGIISDDNWMAIQSSPISLTAVRTWLANNGRTDVVLASTYASVGQIRILFQEGQRVLDFPDNFLGYFTYASAFNRMYIALSNLSGTMAASSGVISWLELTPADLKAMGADITIDGSGNGTLNSPLILNSIILK